MKMKKSQLEAEFERIWIEVTKKYADPAALKLKAEHPFAKEVGRKFRFDFCHMEQRVAVEIMGGTWTGGRHTSPQGYKRDCEKLLYAAELEWKVIYLTSDMVNADYLKRIADIILARNIVKGPNHDWVISHTVENRGTN